MMRGVPLLWRGAATKWRRGGVSHLHNQNKSFCKKIFVIPACAEMTKNHFVKEIS
jgi:hypothetical protein